MMKQWFKVLLATLAGICLTWTASAQSITVRGTVTDAAGEPLIGVSVFVMNTSDGAITDLDGNFELQARKGDVLVISYVGFSTQNITVSGSDPIRVALVEDSEFLDEVVVVGYGVQKKSDITGSIASVRSEDLKNTTSESVGQAIQGKVSGVQVLTLSGAPGSESHIRVRGYSSNNVSNPLYLVDGLKVTDISYLNPESIKSIEILKDAASAAIYGAEAGNGVILITTQTGDKGKSRIFYNGQYASQSVAKKVEMMDAATFKDFWQEAGYAASSFQNADTDWQNELYGMGYMTQHTVGFEGANDRGSFFLSLNYLKNNGMIVGNHDVNDRLSAQINASYKINDWLNVGTTNSVEYRALSKIINENSAQLTQNAIGATYLYDPTVPLTYANDADAPADLLAAEAAGHAVARDENGNLYGATTFMRSPGNPVGDLDRTDVTEYRMNLNGTIFGNITPMKGLTLTSRLGYRLGSTHTDTYAGPYYWNSGWGSDNVVMSSSAMQTFFYQWENFGNYNVTLGKHDIGAMVGMQFAKGVGRMVSGSTDSLTSILDNFHDLSASTQDASKGVGGYKSETSNWSWFARLSYTYASKYLLTVNFRADAFDTSKLSAKNRWGYFPSVSLGWIASREDFIKNNISPDILSFLKFRGSWGINGNVNSLSGYAWASTVSLNNSTSIRSADYSFLDKMYNGASPSRVLANPDLRWERSMQMDAGLEARFFKDRLNFAVDFYQKNTTDLLTTAKAPSVSGASTQYVNMGKIRNTGWDIELGWKDTVGDFSYGISGNISFLKNKVLESPYGDGRYAGGGGYFTDATYFEAGYPIWYLRTYIVDHIDKYTGMPVYKTAEELGTDDGKDYVGSPIPKFTGGITLTASWKSFDFRLFGTGSYGNKLYWAIPRLDPTTMLGNLPAVLVSDYWSWTNTDGTQPTPGIWARTGDLRNYGSSDHFVFDASFFRIKEIQLGYSLPKKVASKAGLSNLRLYVSLDNFFTFTKYPGNNPETMAGMTEGETSQSMGMKLSGGMGVDRLMYPAMKQIVVGLNLSF